MQQRLGKGFSQTATQRDLMYLKPNYPLNIDWKDSSPESPIGTAVQSRRLSPPQFFTARNMVAAHV